MTKVLHAEGSTGRVAIYDESNPDAFTNPVPNLDDVFFHSDLDYMGIAANIEVTVTHPARAKGAPAEAHSYATPTFYAATSDPLAHNLGYVPHGLCFIGNDMLPANTQIQFVGTSFRTVALELTANELRIFETCWVYNTALPAITKTYRIVLFTPKIQPSGNTMIEIKPERVIASGGKLDTNLNYIRRASQNPDFYFSKGRTADANNGSFKIVTANGSTIVRSPYAGSFTGVPGIGIEI